MRTKLNPNLYANPYNTFFRSMNDVADMVDRMMQSDTRPGARALRSAAGLPTRVAPSEQTVKLPVDARITDEAYEVTAYLPGVNPDDVEILFEEDALTVRGAFPAIDLTESAEEGKQGEWVKQELFHGKFERKLSFRQPVDPEGIVAEYRQGVLTLRVPKAAEAKPRQIRVTAK